MLIDTSSGFRYALYLAAGLVMVLCQFCACGMLLLLVFGAAHGIVTSLTFSAAVAESTTAVAHLAPMAFCCWQLVLGRGRLLHRIAIYISLAISAYGLWYGIFLPAHVAVTRPSESVMQWEVACAATCVITFFALGLPLTVGLLARYWLYWRGRS